MSISREEAAAAAAAVLGQYMEDWSPEDRADALSDLKSVTVTVIEADADEPDAR